MTEAFNLAHLAESLNASVAGAVVQSDKMGLDIEPERLVDVCRFLKNAPECDFDYLNSITAIDYKTHFEVIYRMVSTKYNHFAVLKTRLTNRDTPTTDSVFEIWRGADLQEREIFDLFGISFRAHPELTRIFLWEGFPGYPLRKDWQERAV